MEKTNFNRLVRVLIPFIAMVIVQNTILYPLSAAGVSGVIPSLIAFVIASAVAVFIFYAKVIDTPEETTPEERSGGVVGSVMYFFCTAAVLIITMYAVAFIMSNYSAAQTKTTPIHIVSVLVIHPILEEYIFRGLFYNELRKLSPMFGVITQAVMFAIIHGTIDGMIYALISGIFLGIAMEKTGKLWVPWAVHVFINARSLVYLNWLYDNSAVRRQIDVAVISVGIIALLILVLMRGISALTVDSKQKDVISENNSND